MRYEVWLISTQKIKLQNEKKKEKKEKIYGKRIVT